MHTRTHLEATQCCCQHEEFAVAQPHRARDLHQHANQWRLAA
jgi:hypothetical protein